MPGAYNIIFAEYFNAVMGYLTGGRSFRINDYKIAIYKAANYLVNKVSEAIAFNSGPAGFNPRV